MIALFVFCAFSDFLDGFLAREFNWTSKTGALLDSPDRFRSNTIVLNF
ncbi:CDP-alcohol phosphatidyltransferase family protein [Myxococcota bacterium]|nr:CDP-alcohol phosphatidyltransferase family protein [Myxococcota bacterium]MBU1380585.1 CDP-alcohol phosphatidyltransferase family protein [Myxococcota bacterium]MBU1497163.1 CDP-alcohol phosphatidyltransferase family protein [Myxococcota bacterium]